MRCSAGTIGPGAKVRVTSPTTVFHVPKQKSGLQLEGMVGEVVERADLYDGKQLSANLPLKVSFEFDDGGKKIKFIAHVAEHEVELC